MDFTLIKKMDIYPTDAALAGLIPSRESGETTLIKADISLFHQSTPLPESSLEAGHPLLSDYEAGLAEGQSRAETLYQDTVSVMQRAVSALEAELASMARQIERSHLSAVSDCLRAVFPALMRGGTDLELQAILEKACGSTLKGRIQLSFHPDDQAYCEQLCEGAQDITLAPDPSLAPKQMCLKWIGGGGEIDCQGTAKACLTHLETALHDIGSTKARNNSDE